MSHWTYTTIFDKLKSKCNEQGVLVQQIDPAYRSQRCHRCGWTSKLNRKGKQFKCVNCKTTVDADLNASFNLKLELTLLKKSILLKYRKKKLKGFFWNTSCQECIVPDVQIENLKKN
jgi:transposase